jgi:hypothetical protein
MNTQTKIRTIDLQRSIHDLCDEYPEIVGIMQELGFTDVVKPGMLATVGRIMTIPRGAGLRKISLDAVREAFASHGFLVI